MKCCICKKGFEGFGNNPAPVKLRGQCCDKCNEEVVIPVRINNMSGVRRMNLLNKSRKK